MTLLSIRFLKASFQPVNQRCPLTIEIETQNSQAYSFDLQYLHIFCSLNRLGTQLLELHFSYQAVREFV